MNQVRDTRAGYQMSGTPVVLAPGMAVECEHRGKRHSGYVAQIEGGLVWVRLDTNEPVRAFSPRDLRIVPSNDLKPGDLVHEARRLVDLAHAELGHEDPFGRPKPQSEPRRTGEPTDDDQTALEIITANERPVRKASRW